MATQSDGILRGAAWSEAMPWLKLFRVFRLAISARSLFLAVMGLLLTGLGWWGLHWGLDPSTEPISTELHCPWRLAGRMVPDKPWVPGVDSRESPLDSRLSVASPIERVWEMLSQPLVSSLFDAKLTLRGLIYVILCGVWGTAVWAFFGAAITRSAAVQLAIDERVSWASLMKHATTKWSAYFGAPLLPALGIVLIAVPFALLGLLLRLQIGVLILGILWPLLLIGGLLMTITLLGLLFGWPLMWATISTENSDSFEALSRSYHYVFQRPLHYLFYLLVVGVVGALGWLLVSQFAAGVVGLTYWATSWGAGQAQIDAIVAHGKELGSLGAAGAAVIHFWTGCVKLVAVGFLFSFFWTSTAAVYLVLRRDVDATEMDEVVLDEEEQPYGLPPMKTDAAGAPVLGENPPASNDKIAQGQDEE